MPTNRIGEPSAIARLATPASDQQASPGHAEHTLPRRRQPTRMRRQRSADEGGAERRQRERECCCMQLPDDLERRGSARRARRRRTRLRCAARRRARRPPRESLRRPPRGATSQRLRRRGAATSPCSPVTNNEQQRQVQRPPDPTEIAPRRPGSRRGRRGPHSSGVAEGGRSRAHDQHSVLNDQRRDQRDRGGADDPRRGTQVSRIGHCWCPAAALAGDAPIAGTPQLCSLSAEMAQLLARLTVAAGLIVTP